METFPKINKTFPLFLPPNEHSVTSKFRKGTVERPKSSKIPNMFTDSLFGEMQTNRKLHRTNSSPRCVIRGSVNCIISKLAVIVNPFVIFTLTGVEDKSTQVYLC